MFDSQNNSFEQIVPCPKCGEALRVDKYESRDGEVWDMATCDNKVCPLPLSYIVVDGVACNPEVA